MGPDPAALRPAEPVNPGAAPAAEQPAWVTAPTGEWPAQSGAYPGAALVGPDGGVIAEGHLLVGKRVRLAANTWGRHETERIGLDVHMDVLAVYLKNGGAWLIGHPPECAWPHADEHAPCYVVYVTAQGLNDCQVIETDA